MAILPAEARVRRSPEQAVRENLSKETRKQRRVTPMRTLVRKHARELLDVVPVWPKPPTIGIVTFNLSQRRTILDEIDTRRAADPGFSDLWDTAATRANSRTAVRKPVSPPASVRSARKGANAPQRRRFPREIGGHRCLVL